MDVLFAEASALEVARLVRRSPTLRLVPAEDAGGIDPEALTGNPDEMRHLNYVASGLSAPPARTHVVSVRVAKASQRRQAIGLRYLTVPKGLPPGSFLQLEAIGEDSAIMLFDGRCVYVDSVPLACAAVAASYQRLIRSGNLYQSDAVIRLVEIVMEFAGHYGRDAADSRGGAVEENLPPMTSVSAIREFVDASSGIPGVGLLAQALRYARDGSRSAMETCLWISLVMPEEYGLYGFRGAKLNVPLVPTAAQRAMMRHKTLTPDILWDERGVGIEYQGAGHGSRNSFAEDNRRMSDYLVCGLTVRFVTFDDVRTVAGLDKLALWVARAMAEHGHGGELRRIERFLGDDAARAARARNLMRLLPPKRGV